MGGYDDNAVPVSIISNEISKKYKLEPKSNKSEGESAEHIQSNKHVPSMEDSLSKKHTRASCDPRDPIKDLLHSNHSPSSSERKRRSAESSEYLLQKRQKHSINSSGSSEMRNSMADRIEVEEHEKSGSSGKRSRDSLEEGGDESAAKRRKVWLKMLGPLKLPDYVDGFKYDYELYPEITELNKQLIEINKKLRPGGVDREHMENKSSSSSPPILKEIGVSANTKESRLRKKLRCRRQQIICELNQKNPLLLPPLDDKPTKLSRKIYLPVKQYPNYNFIGLIIGPRGHTQKRMERESGARILLRGKGSMRPWKGRQQKLPIPDPYEDEDLHVYIEAKDEESLESASEMVEKLLVPANEEANEHRHAQLSELARLNSDVSMETRNSAAQKSIAFHAAPEGTKPIAPPPSSNPASAKPAPEIENNLQKLALVSFLHCMMNSPDDSSKSVAVIDKSKLFVGFLPPSVNTMKLMELFSRFGPLSEAVVVTDRRTRLSKGYGFVKYRDPFSAAEALVRMNGYRIEGKMLAVRIAGRAPLNANTVIGPRAMRLPQAVAGGWDKLPPPMPRSLPESLAGFFSGGNVFPFCSDSMCRRPHAFIEFVPFHFL